MRILVVTSEPISADDLRAQAGQSAMTEDAHVMVVAPALHENPLQFWLSDADDAISRAASVSRRTLDNLSESGVAVSADTGDSDPALAIEDALATYDADQVIVFIHPDDEQLHRETLDVSKLEARVGIPVRQAQVNA